MERSSFLLKMPRLFEVTNVFDIFGKCWVKLFLEAFITKLSRNCTLQIFSSISLNCWFVARKKFRGFVPLYFRNIVTRRALLTRTLFIVVSRTQWVKKHKLNANRESWKHEKFLHNRDQNDAVIRTTEVRKTGYEIIRRFWGRGR